MFRVQAVNAYGLSEESQESAPLFIDAALCTYTTMLTSMLEVRPVYSGGIVVYTDTYWCGCIIQTLSVADAKLCKCI